MTKLNKIYKQFYDELKDKMGLGYTFSEQDVEDCARNSIEKDIPMDQALDEYMDKIVHNLYDIVSEYIQEKKDVYLDKYNNKNITKEELSEYLEALSALEEETIDRKNNE